MCFGFQSSSVRYQVDYSETRRDESAPQTYSIFPWFDSGGIYSRGCLESHRDYDGYTDVSIPVLGSGSM